MLSFVFLIFKKATAHSGKIQNKHNSASYKEEVDDLYFLRVF